MPTLARTVDLIDRSSEVRPYNDDHSVGYAELLWGIATVVTVAHETYAIQVPKPRSQPIT